MIVRLLDVNVLISLLDSAHANHAASVAWFRGFALVEGWATCPITENGLVRIVSQVSYPNLRVTTAMAAQSLARLKSNFADSYRFWASEVSIADDRVFDLNVLTGPRQTTDAYLAGLAFRKGGRLATFDKAIPWRAVRGAGEELVERIPVA